MATAFTTNYRIEIEPVSRGSTGEDNNIRVQTVQDQQPSGPKSITLTCTARQIGAIQQYLAKIAAGTTTTAVETAIWAL